MHVTHSQFGIVDGFDLNHVHNCRGMTMVAR